MEFDSFHHQRHAQPSEEPQAEAVTAHTGAQSAWAWRGIYLKALPIRHAPQHGNYCCWVTGAVQQCLSS